MKKGRFLLMHVDRYVYRFESLMEAQLYAYYNCRGSYEFYVIVDLEEDRIVSSWYY